MCDRTGCRTVGTLRPIILISHRSCPDVVIRAQLTLKICRACSKLLVLGDLVDDASWASICAGFAKAGKILPTRELTDFDFIELDSDEAKQGNRDFGFSEREPN